jgi:hypothetical protein
VRRDVAVARVGPHRFKPGPDRISPPRNLRLLTDRALLASSHRRWVLARQETGSGQSECHAVRAGDFYSRACRRSGAVRRLFAGKALALASPHYVHRDPLVGDDAWSGNGVLFTQVALPGPTCEGHGEHQVIVVPLAPRLVRVVPGGDVDLDLGRAPRQPSMAKKLCLY